MEWAQELLEWLRPHWPGITWSFMAMLIGQVMTRHVWTKARSTGRGTKVQFFYWMRKSLPLHPVFAGAVLGILWQNPENADPAWPLIGSVMYFATFGGLSVWLYQVIKQFAKRRGYDIELPGASSRPAPKSSLPPRSEVAKIVATGKNPALRTPPLATSLADQLEPMKEKDK